MTKVCSKCGESKDLEEFYVNRASPSGRRPECKLCNSSKPQTKAYRIEYNRKNKAKLQVLKKEYYEINKSVAAIKNKLYHTNNRESINARKREYQRKRREIPIIRLKRNIRTLISGSFKNKGFSKKSKTAQILGCSFIELQEHLRLSFEANYGIPFNYIDRKMLHIDHIIPLASAKTVEALVKLNHYSNLQYLFSWDNIAKGRKIY